MNLLEKYDNKLDEMQEDIEIKELKIYEYELEKPSQDRIRFESVEEKI